MLTVVYLPGSATLLLHEKVEAESRCPGQPSESTVRCSGGGVGEGGGANVCVRARVCVRERECVCMQACVCV